MVTDKDFMIIKNQIEKLFTAESLVPKKWQFRSSALPFCPMDYALSRMTEELNKPVSHKWGFTADFYTGIGTGLHSAVQRWLGKINLLYGNWRCESCKITLRNLLGTQYCPECHKEMIYEEYTLEDKENDFSGHCDGILYFPKIEKPWLFELKSMGSFRIKKLMKNDELPLWYHIIQTSMYSHLLRKKYNLDLEGIVFLYIPRNIDDIFKGHQVFIHKKLSMTDRVYESIIKEYNEVKFNFESGKFMDIKRSCSCEEDAQDCPWKNLFCFSINFEKYYKELIEEYKTLKSGDNSENL